MARSSRSSRRGRRRSVDETPWGSILKVAGGAAALIAAGVTYFLVNQKVENTDADTWCDRAGPKEVHLVLLDASDPLDGVKTEAAKAHVLKAIKAAPPGARVDVYLADRADGSLGEPIFMKCNPGEPSGADALISNAKKKRDEYENGYLAAVENIMAAVLQAPPLKTSPIIESLRSAATKSFARLSDDVPTRITIISDMVQNSSLLKHRSATDSFETFEASPAWTSALVNLHHASIHIVYVTRANYRAIQGNGHINWWARYFEAMNGNFIDSEAI
jgi:hypothetical protein